MLAPREFAAVTPMTEVDEAQQRYSHAIVGPSSKAKRDVYVMRWSTLEEETVLLESKIKALEEGAFADMKQNQVHETRHDANTSTAADETDHEANSAAINSTCAPALWTDCLFIEDLIRDIIAVESNAKVLAAEGVVTMAAVAAVSSKATATTITANSNSTSVAGARERSAPPSFGDTIQRFGDVGHPAKHNEGDNVQKVFSSEFSDMTHRLPQLKRRAVTLLAKARSVKAALPMMGVVAATQLHEKLELEITRGLAFVASAGVDVAASFSPSKGAASPQQKAPQAQTALNFFSDIAISEGLAQEVRTYTSAQRLSMLAACRREINTLVLQAREMAAAWAAEDAAEAESEAATRSVGHTKRREKLPTETAGVGAVDFATVEEKGSKYLANAIDAAATKSYERRLTNSNTDATQHHFITSKSSAIKALIPSAFEEEEYRRVAHLLNLMKSAEALLWGDKNAAARRDVQRWKDAANEELRQLEHFDALAGEAPILVSPARREEDPSVAGYHRMTLFPRPDAKHTDLQSLWDKLDALEAEDAAEEDLSRSKQVSETTVVNATKQQPFVVLPTDERRALLEAQQLAMQIDFRPYEGKRFEHEGPSKGGGDVFVIGDEAFLPSHPAKNLLVADGAASSSSSPAEESNALILSDTAANAPDPNTLTATAASLPTSRLLYDTAEMLANMLTDDEAAAAGGCGEIASENTEAAAADVGAEEASRMADMVIAERQRPLLSKAAAEENARRKAVEAEAEAEAERIRRENELHSRRFIAKFGPMLFSRTKTDASLTNSTKYTPSSSPSNVAATNLTQFSALPHASASTPQLIKPPLSSRAFTASNTAPSSDTSASPPDSVATPDNGDNNATAANNDCYFNRYDRTKSLTARSAAEKALQTRNSLEHFKGPIAHQNKIISNLKAIGIDTCLVPGGEYVLGHLNPKESCTLLPIAESFDKSSRLDRRTNYWLCSQAPQLIAGTAYKGGEQHFMYTTAPRHVALHDWAVSSRPITTRQFLAAARDTRLRAEMERILLSIDVDMYMDETFKTVFEPSMAEASAAPSANSSQNAIGYLDGFIASVEKRVRDKHCIALRPGSALATVSTALKQPRLDAANSTAIAAHRNNDSNDGVDSYADDVAEVPFFIAEAFARALGGVVCPPDVWEAMATGVGGDQQHFITPNVENVPSILGLHQLQWSVTVDGGHRPVKGSSWRITEAEGLRFLRGQEGQFGHALIGRGGFEWNQSVDVAFCPKTAAEKESERSAHIDLRSMYAKRRADAIPPPTPHERLDGVTKEAGNSVDRTAALVAFNAEEAEARSFAHITAHYARRHEPETMAALKEKGFSEAILTKIAAGGLPPPSFVNWRPPHCRHGGAGGGASHILRSATDHCTQTIYGGEVTNVVMFQQEHHQSSPSASLSSTSFKEIHLPPPSKRCYDNQRGFSGPNFHTFSLPHHGVATAAFRIAVPCCGDGAAMLQNALYEYDRRVGRHVTFSDLTRALGTGREVIAKVLPRGGGDEEKDDADRPATPDRYGGGGNTPAVRSAGGTVHRSGRINNEGGHSSLPSPSSPLSSGKGLVGVGGKTFATNEGESIMRVRGTDGGVDGGYDGFSAPIPSYKGRGEGWLADIEPDLIVPAGGGEDATFSDTERWVLAGCGVDLCFSIDTPHTLRKIVLYGAHRSATSRNPSVIEHWSSGAFAMKGTASCHFKKDDKSSSSVLAKRQKEALIASAGGITAPQAGVVAGGSYGRSSSSKYCEAVLASISSTREGCEKEKKDEEEVEECFAAVGDQRFVPYIAGGMADATVNNTNSKPLHQPSRTPTKRFTLQPSSSSSPSPSDVSASSPSSNPQQPTLQVPDSATGIIIRTDSLDAFCYALPLCGTALIEADDAIRQAHTDAMLYKRYLAEAGERAKDHAAVVRAAKLSIGSTGGGSSLDPNRAVADDPIIRELRERRKSRRGSSMVGTCPITMPQRKSTVEGTAMRVGAVFESPPSYATPSKAFSSSPHQSQQAPPSSSASTSVVPPCFLTILEDSSYRTVYTDRITVRPPNDPKRLLPDIVRYVTVTWAKGFDRNGGSVVNEVSIELMDGHEKEAAM